MPLFEQCLMKWREPKIKGLVTLKSFVWLIVLSLFVSIPFGFFVPGGHGRFSLTIWLVAMAFLCVGFAAAFLHPLLPGDEIQLTKTAIVRKMPRRKQRSAYKEIDCCYFYRDFTYAIERNTPADKVHNRHANDEKFTHFHVVLRGEGAEQAKREFSLKSLRWVKNFGVPASVNLDSVLKILRENNVRVVEPALTPGAKPI